MFNKSSARGLLACSMVKHFSATIIQYTCFNDAPTASLTASLSTLIECPEACSHSAFLVASEDEGKHGHDATHVVPYPPTHGYSSIL